MAEERRMRLLGLHHVTAIVRDLDRTTAFYRDLLGLSLVQRTRNPDDPDARHFWFAAADGGVGATVSFMEYPEMPDGSVGAGSTHHIALRVGSADEVAAWRDYLRGRGVPCTDVLDRAGLRSLYFRDPDGHLLEIAANGASPPAPGGDAPPVP